MRTLLDDEIRSPPPTSPGILKFARVQNIFEKIAR